MQRLSSQWVDSEIKFQVAIEVHVYPQRIKRGKGTFESKLYLELITYFINIIH